MVAVPHCDAVGGEAEIALSFLQYGKETGAHLRLSSCFKSECNLESVSLLLEKKQTLNKADKEG